MTMSSGLSVSHRHTHRPRAHTPGTEKRAQLSPRPGSLGPLLPPPYTPLPPPSLQPARHPTGALVLPLPVFEVHPLAAIPIAPDLVLRLIPTLEANTATEPGSQLSVAKPQFPHP